ncbi:MAG: hypothetical protein M0R06_01090 [Sphaerochaeta sp.]|nr:hypothetical protein [Sphaerochaeta sp.]
MKLPVKKVDIALAGDYEGFTLTIRKNFTTEQFDAIVAARETGKFSEMRNAMAGLILSWNFADEDGKSLPIGAESFKILPVEMVSEIFTKMSEAVFTVPNA